MAEFRKGDIVRNVYAGERNPSRYLLYLGKSTIQQGRYKHKGYDCLNYDGKKFQLFRDPEPLVFVGHMPEFDAFMTALADLRNRREDGE